jgi:hypothetical protein
MSVFKPKKPKVAPAPPPPERTDSETTALADEQRRRAVGAEDGRAASFLTSSGLTEGSAAVRFLGGAART